MGGFPSPATTYEKPRRSNTNTSITPCSSNYGHTSTSMSGSSLPGRTHSTHCTEKTNGGASTPHPHTRRNSIPAAQECTPPASLCRGFRHTRATIGDVGKPRAIRQNTLVGAFPGVAAWWTSSFPQITSSASQVALWTHLRAGSRLFACKGVGGVGVGRSGPECRWWRGRRAHPAASRAQVCMEGCGGEWFGAPVPRLFLCVVAVHPIRRQCTSSVRVHRHVTGAPPRNGCTAT